MYGYPWFMDIGLKLSLLYGYPWIYVDIHLNILRFLWIPVHRLAMDSRSRATKGINSRRDQVLN